MGNAYLHFWGVRGSYASPFETHLKVGGNTSCVEIREGDHVLICDAGTGIIPFGNKMMAQDDIRELMIILTHYHWDHICGLPFFVPAFVPDWKINIFGHTRDVVVNPKDPDTMYIATADHGITVSTNRGKSWNALTSDLKYKNTITDLDFCNLETPKLFTSEP